MTNAASERGQAKAKKLAQEDWVHTELAIRSLMKTISGRRWIWLQLEFAGPFRANYCTDPMASAHQEGLRAAGLRLLSQVQKICPQEYLAMTTENTGVAVAQPEEQPDVE